MRLAGKVAIVTGGNRGIGKAISLAFAREGAKVAVVGRNKSLCEEVAGQITKDGGEAIAIQTDVSNEAEVAQMTKQTKDKYDRIDILVNNAAVNLPYRAVVDLTLDEWNRVLKTNSPLSLAPFYPSASERWIAEFDLVDRNVATQKKQLSPISSRKNRGTDWLSSYFGRVYGIAKKYRVETDSLR